MTLAPAPSAPKTASGPIVYVLDDDQKICTLISRMLHVAGFVAVSFSKPDQCLTQLKAADAYKTPTIIILDLSLGGTDGIEVLNELQKLKYKNKVLLISGKDESALLEIERMGVARGLLMLPSLKKPFQLDDLTKRLKIELDPVKPSPAEPITNNSTTALERAVANGELVRRYQARVDIKSVTVCGAEMVLYEQRPSDGLVPLTISSLPSSSPIFHPLSRFLIRTVLEDWSQHLSDISTRVRLFIKLPLSVITTSNFLHLLRNSLLAYPRFPGLVIEVSDWNQFKNVRIIQEVSAQLKLYNVGLSIDDVGALYSAIVDSYKLPFEEFKLNSKLISNCAMNETKKILCMNTVSLAHDTGASVCADGVADRDEFEAVIDMKCDMVQGSWFGKPQPMEAFRANLLARNSPQKTAVNSDANSFEWPDAVSA